MKKATIRKIILYLILIFFTAVFVLPILMILIGSLKVDESQIMKDLKSFRAFLPVGELGLTNYKEIIKRIDIFHFLKNSLIITAGAILIGTMVNSMLGYALARLKFRGKNLILKVVISLLIIPGEAIIMPQLLIVNQMNLIDTLTVQIFPSVADAFTIFMFYQAFLSIPRELEEASIVDGLSYPGIYARIVMPLSKPTIVTTIILSSLGRWGDVLWPTMVTRGKNVRPLAVGINQLFSNTSKYWGDIFAAAVFLLLPILVLYIIFQRQFVESMVSSGIKG
jgi:multiple sugar transport system permease protein